ncbi:helix-turn-helix domain-containing protein [Bacillaceae bacterium S4-13-58]
MEIGIKLKEAREAKGLTLEDIQEKTKIQKRYLQAIEKGDFSVMPGQFYTRAFIRQYAEVVDLDPTEVLDDYKSEIPPPSNEEYVNYSRVQSHHSNSSNRTSAVFSVFPKIIVTILIIGIIVFAWYFYTQMLEKNNSEQPQNEINGNNEVILPDEPDRNNANNTGEINNQEIPEEDVDQPENIPEEESEPTIQLVEPGTEDSLYHKYELVQGDQILIELNVEDASAETYIDVENGKGAVLYSNPARNLRKENSPQTLDASGEEKVIINVGNAKALHLIVNGETIEFPIDPTIPGNEHQWIEITKAQ